MRINNLETFIQKDDLPLISYIVGINSKKHYLISESKKLTPSRINLYGEYLFSKEYVALKKNYSPTDIISLETEFKNKLIKFKDNHVNYIDLGFLNLKKFPEDIFSLTNLKELYLTENSISSLPQKLLDFNNLNCISLQHNPLDLNSKEILKRLSEKGIEVFY